jgi:hypothetical protein
VQWRMLLASYRSSGLSTRRSRYWGARRARASAIAQPQMAPSTGCRPGGLYKHRRKFKASSWPGAAKCVGKGTSLATTKVSARRQAGVPGCSGPPPKEQPPTTRGA